MAGDFVVEDVRRHDTRIRGADRPLRPGDTVSVPPIFALADAAVDLALLARTCSIPPRRALLGGVLELAFDLGAVLDH